MDETELWIAEQMYKFHQQEAYERQLELELGGNYSMENIMRVAREKLYGEEA